MDSNIATNFMQLLNPDNTMSFNRLLAHAIGANETIIYFSLISKMTYYENKGRLDKDGYFFATASDIQESTTFTQRQQSPAIKKLVAIGLIETKIKGVPAKKYYHIIYDPDLILNLIEKGREVAASIKQKKDVKTSFDKMSKLEETAEIPQVEQNVETRIDKMSKQDSTKCYNKNEQNVETSIDEMSKQDSTKCHSKNEQNVAAINLNINNLNNNNQSTINQSIESDGLIDGEEHTSDTMLDIKSQTSTRFSLSDEYREQIYNEIKSKDFPVSRSDESDLSYIPCIDDNSTEEDKYREIIKKNIEYNYLLEYDLRCYKEELDSIIEIMVEMVVYNKQNVKINGNMYPAEIVKNRFLKLNSNHIVYVHNNYSENNNGIRNIKAYLITMLYNSYTTTNHYYTQRVNHDLYGGGL